MNYKEQVFKGMELLNSHPKTIFIGQAVEYNGTSLTHQVKKFPKDKLLELPVAEELQAGMALGLALEGYIPVSIYPRMNFIILAMNQIVNHLDKWEAMSVGQSKPKIIMKYPTLKNADKLKYIDENNKCYKYTPKEVNCPEN